MNIITKEIRKDLYRCQVGEYVITLKRRKDLENFRRYITKVIVSHADDNLNKGWNFSFWFIGLNYSIRLLRNILTHITIDQFYQIIKDDQKCLLTSIEDPLDILLEEGNVL